MRPPAPEATPLSRSPGRTSRRLCRKSALRLSRLRPCLFGANSAQCAVTLWKSPRAARCS
jgi:hypothetical protein